MKDYGYLGTINWLEMMSSDSIQDNWDNFKHLLRDAISHYVPTSVPKLNKSPPWLSKSLSRTINAKHAAFSRYRKFKTHSDYVNYKAKRNEVKTKIRAAQLSYEQSLLDKFRSNPKAFYSYIKSKQKVKPGIGPLERSDGTFTSSDLEIADDLNNFFESTLILPMKI